MTGVEYGNPPSSSRLKYRCNDTRIEGSRYWNIDVCKLVAIGRETESPVSSALLSNKEAETVRSARSGKRRCSSYCKIPWNGYNYLSANGNASGTIVLVQ